MIPLFRILYDERINVINTGPEVLLDSVEAKLQGAIEMKDCTIEYIKTKNPTIKELQEWLENANTDKGDSKELSPSNS